MHASRLLIVAAALLAPSLAAAGELDVAIASGGGEQKMTHLDVVGGTLPSVGFRGDNGERFRLGLTLDHQGERVVFGVTVSSVKEKKSGTEKVKLITNATVETSDGQPATLEMSLPGKAGGLTLVMTPRMEESLNRPGMLE